MDGAAVTDEDVDPLIAAKADLPSDDLFYRVLGIGLERLQNLS
jgi:hypothetical protein